MSYDGRLDLDDVFAALLVSGGSIEDVIYQIDMANGRRYITWYGAERDEVRDALEALVTEGSVQYGSALCGTVYVPSGERRF